MTSTHDLVFFLPFSLALSWNPFSFLFFSFSLFFLSKLLSPPFFDPFCLFLILILFLLRVPAQLPVTCPFVFRVLVILTSTTTYHPLLRPGLLNQVKSYPHIQSSPSLYLLQIIPSSFLHPSEKGKTQPKPPGSNFHHHPCPIILIPILEHNFFLNLMMVMMVIFLFLCALSL